MHTISKGKSHCILVLLILFISVFLSLPLFLIRLANEEFNMKMEPMKINETSGKPECSKGFLPCSDGHCLKQVYVCDRVPDCPEGIDEDEITCCDINGAMNDLVKDIIDHKSSNSVPLAIPSSCDEERLQNDTCPCVLTDPDVIICDNQDFDVIPLHIAQSVYKLRFNNNSITGIGAGLPESLRSLAVNDNKITSIHEWTFWSTPNLSKLYAGHNNISYIHPEAFKTTRSLAVVHLEFNQLNSLPRSLIDGKPLLELHMENNQLDLGPEISFSTAPVLKELFLDYNRISTVRRSTFSNLTKLMWLSLSHNRISSIDLGAFENNLLLHELNLNSNHIKTIDRRMFATSLTIQNLNLRANPIEELPKDAFAELRSMGSLNLTEIHFRKPLERETFNLPNLTFIYFAKFSYCYSASNVRVCRAPSITDGISTFENLLAFSTLRYAVWIVASVCILGNITVLIWRTISKEEDESFSLFVRNLSIADLMMGIYLCTIAWKDIEFSMDFRKHADTWMSSWECTTIGFLALFSSEMSVFLLTIMTIERYRNIIDMRHPDKETSVKRARVYIAFAWLVAFLIALYPVLDWLRQNSSAYYATNGLCLPFHIEQPYGRNWQYSAFIYLLINFPAVMLMLTLYARLYMIRTDKNNSKPYMMGSESARARENTILAVRFFFIVFTDCLCLIPVVVIRMIAPWLTISSSIYGWLVVFIIPINSALNPILYTLSNPTLLFVRLPGRLRQLSSDAFKWSGTLLSLGASRRKRRLNTTGRARTARTTRGSDNPSSRSSTSATTCGSEAHLILQTGRRRTRAGSSSICFEPSEELSRLNSLQKGKDSPKGSFESALHEQLLARHLAAANNDQQNLLNVQLNLRELNGKVAPTLVSFNRELSLSGPSTSAGSSMDQGTPSVSSDDGNLITATIEQRQNSQTQSQLRLTDESSLIVSSSERSDV